MITEEEAHQKFLKGHYIELSGGFILTPIRRYSKKLEFYSNLALYDCYSNNNIDFFDKDFWEIPSPLGGELLLVLANKSLTELEDLSDVDLDKYKTPFPAKIILTTKDVIMRNNLSSIFQKDIIDNLTEFLKGLEALNAYSSKPLELYEPKFRNASSLRKKLFNYSKQISDIH